MLLLREYVETRRECVINWIPLNEAQTLPQMYPDLFPPNECDLSKCIPRMKDQGLEHCFIRFYRGKQFSFNNYGPYKEYGNCISWNQLMFSKIPQEDFDDLQEII